MKDDDIRVEGHWHQSGNAGREPAFLIVSAERSGNGKQNSKQIEVVDVNGKSLEQGTQEFSISDRIGSVARTVSFADGSIFVTQDNDTIDLAFSDQNRAAHWLHALESSKRWVLLSLVATALLTFSFFRWGLPWASLHIAHALPERAGQVISSSTLDFLDRWVLKETELDAQTTTRIEEHFRTQLLPLNTGIDSSKFNLLFRKWSIDGEPVANALALPGGEIILTDAFVELCETQQEMDSVIFHEIGHIVERHSLQRVVEASFITTAIMLLTGDGGGLSDLGVGLGSLLVSSHYSRNHETSADRYAFDQMLRAGMDPAVFGDILERLSTQTLSEAEEESTSTDDDSEETSAEKSTESNKRKTYDIGYFASHPRTEKRIEQAARYSECFNRGETSCDVE